MIVCVVVVVVVVVVGGGRGARFFIFEFMLKSGQTRKHESP